VTYNLPMRHHIQELPGDLPNASLYLDDIETITRILTAAAVEADVAYAALIAARVPRLIPAIPDGAKLAVEEKPAVVDNTKVVYRIGQEEMDFDDLLEQGGSVTNLRVSVFTPRDSWARCVLDFSWLGKPRLSLHAIMQPGKEWEVHAKVRDIFEKRRSVVKNFVDDLPSSLKYGAWLIMMAVVFLAQDLKGPAQQVVYVFVGSLTVLFLLGSVVVARPNRVYLVRRHEQSRTKSASRTKFWKGAGIFVLGAFFTKLLDYLYTHFLK
jgi:hypothetical protein